MMVDFRGQKIIVTGGGRGIGRGITKAFAKAGAEVIICARNKPEDFSDDISQKIHFTALDIRLPDSAEKLIEFSTYHEGELTTLINNAGGSPAIASEEASASLTEKVIQLNLLAPIFLSQATYKHMKKHHIKGSIINISSVSAIRSSPTTVAYGAAKAGLLNMTTSLAMEWAPHIRVNAIIAGLIKTEASKKHYGGEKGMHYLAQSLPMKRMGKPDDIAHTCLFLADAKSSYISGACVEVFGGGEPPSFLKIIAEVTQKFSQ